MELLMQTEIFAVNGSGKLRVTTGWYDSALYCNPDDTSPFLWNVYASEHWIRLAPQVSPFNGNFYASLRKDNDFYIQMGVPHMPFTFISDPHSVEPIFFHQGQFFTAQLTALSNYVAVNDQMDTGPAWVNYGHGLIPVGTYQGYRVRCAKNPPDKSCSWYFKTPNAPPNLVANAILGPSASDIQSALKSNNVDISLEELAPLMRQIS